MIVNFNSLYILHAEFHFDGNCRGFTSPMDERKKITKELKRKIGGGGTLIDGIVELQGSHTEVVIKHLKSKGFTQIKKQ